MLCARNPTLPQDQTAMKQPCMSKGGIPVQPFFVLGGYSDNKYRGKYISKRYQVLKGSISKVYQKQERP